MRWFRLTAITACLPGALYAVWAVASGLQSEFHADGAIQSGHAELGCIECHKLSPGNTRQQLQANTKKLLGLRNTAVDFGFIAVDSSTCVDCHERPNDRHPIYRFQEPRFKEARSIVQATSCLGCHGEHTDSRVSISPEICHACHEGLEMKNDPLDISHADLTANEDWQSCLGCHDFHGNHKFQSEHNYSKRISAKAIVDYFGDGVDPYGEDFHYRAIRK